MTSRSVLRAWCGGAALACAGAAAVAQGGPDCAGALANPITLPFTASGLTTCGSGNNFTAGNTSPCGPTAYLGGEDRVFAFTPTATGLINVQLTSSSSWVGLMLYNGCPQGGACVGSSSSGAGNQTVQASVNAGTTYFLLVDSWPAPNCHPSFNLQISAPAPLPPPTTQDCFGSIPVCQGIYQEANSPVGTGNYPNEINSSISCLGGGEVAGQWYTFTVQSSGTFCFSIIPNNMANDYDWAVYNLTNATCADIFTTASLQVSCNFSGLSGITGANGLGGAQNNPCIPVQVGQRFALYVSNWSQSPFGYTLNMTVAGSTASIFDTSPPALNPNVGMDCGGTQLTVTFSELVACSTVQPTDFTVSGPGGPYTVVSAANPLCASGGSQANSFTLTVSPPLSQAGTYTVALVGPVADLCGNESIPASTTLSTNGALTLDAAVSPSGCGGLAIGSVAAQATGGTPPLSYSLGGPAQASPQFNGLAAGTYTLTVTDGANCTATMTVDIIEQITDMLTTVLAEDVSCFGLGDGTVTATTTGTGGPWHYQWLGPNGQPLQTTPAATSDQITVGPGTYTVIVTQGPVGGGCADTLSATVQEPPLLQWTAQPHDSTICLTGMAQLAAATQGGSAPVSIAWSHGAAGPGPHAVSPGTGQWTYSATATDANGCAITGAPATITVRPAITFIPLEPDTECYGLPVTFAALNVAGGDGAYTFDWGSGPAASSAITVAPPASGNVCVTVRDGCETPAVSSCAWLEVLQTPPLVLSADTTFGCVPLSVRFALRDTTGGAQVHWQFGDGAQLMGDSLATHTYAGAGNFDVAISITWPNGCITDTVAHGMVSTLSIPIAQATWNPRPATINDPVVRFTDLSIPNAVSWQWDFGAFGTSTERDPVVEYPSAAGGTYPVMLVVANALGCTDTLRAWVDVQDEFMVWVPNAFTPNEEGQNEEFFISGNDLSPEGFEFLLFDRWGGLIYATNDLAFRWDGTKDGQRLPQGVYPYRLKVHAMSSPKKRVIHGHVNLLR